MHTHKHTKSHPYTHKHTHTYIHMALFTLSIQYNIHHVFLTLFKSNA